MRRHAAGRTALTEIAGTVLFALAVLTAFAQLAFAQAEQPEDEATPAMFKHSNDTRWWASAQANFIFQAHDASSPT